MVYGDLGFVSAGIAGGWLRGSVTPAILRAGSVNWISNRHYLWYHGAEDKLDLCWWGGSSSSTDPSPPPLLLA